MKSDEYRAAREQMVAEQLIAKGIKDQRLLKIFREIPRHLFVDSFMEHLAYKEYPLPIGFNQTISQPYIIALMLEYLQVEPENTVLEIGTGSGYQTALLANLGKTVYTVEYISELSLKAQSILLKLGIANVRFKIGDGALGWSEFAPFDRIIVSACGEFIPHQLIYQLKENGRLVMPIKKESYQVLILGVKHNNRLIQRKIKECEFVPLITTNKKQN
ncbi:MAG: protein-L-isoaspartate(D-aspartate) O-methyltransferase [candidate division WOR-3 bacterium]|nr:protein-L-isoaspartate(D-aspartate) O-methyltransferase [candidate division WOR-3 bacterium]